VWDIRYRPTLFSDVIGQEGVVQVLKARIKNGTILNTSYIFAGGAGQGKTTLARILARAALCPNVNKETSEPCNACEQCQAILDGNDSAFQEKDAANGGVISVVRSMLDTLPYAPPYGAPLRVWLFDEAHRLSNESQDALLKPIEDKKIVAIFCTTEARKIVGPIYRRCEEYGIRRVSRENILGRVKYVLDCEKVSYQEEALLTVIDHAGGHVRDVINRLETISQTGDITIEAVRENLNLGFVTSFYDTLLSLGDDARVVHLLEDMCEFMSPEDISVGLAEAAMNAFRVANGMHADFTLTDKALAQKTYERFGNSLLMISERLLRSRNVTKVSLTCDLLTLVQNGVVSNLATAQSVVLTVAPPVQAVVQAVPSEPQHTNGVTPGTAVLHGPVVQPPTTPPAPPTLNGKHTPHTNGTISPVTNGARDPLALTSVDHVPGSHPRMTGAPPPTLVFNRTTQSSENGILPPTDWRLQFERRWKR
jgi:DNA polymerase III subunit gamma/tau